MKVPVPANRRTRTAIRRFTRTLVDTLIKATEATRAAQKPSRDEQTNQTIGPIDYPAIPITEATAVPADNQAEESGVAGVASDIRLTPLTWGIVRISKLQ